MITEVRERLSKLSRDYLDAWVRVEEDAMPVTQMAATGIFANGFPNEALGKCNTLGIYRAREREANAMLSSAFSLAARGFSADEIAASVRETYDGWTHSPYGVGQPTWSFATHLERALWQIKGMIEDTENVCVPAWEPREPNTSIYGLGEREILAAFGPRRLGMGKSCEKMLAMVKRYASRSTPEHAFIAGIIKEIHGAKIHDGAGDSVVVQFIMAGKCSRLPGAKVGAGEPWVSRGTSAGARPMGVAQNKSAQEPPRQDGVTASEEVRGVFEVCGIFYEDVREARIAQSLFSFEQVVMPISEADRLPPGAIYFPHVREDSQLKGWGKTAPNFIHLALLWGSFARERSRRGLPVSCEIRDKISEYRACAGPRFRRDIWAMNARMRSGPEGPRVFCHDADDERCLIELAMRDKPDKPGRYRDWTLDLESGLWTSVPNARAVSARKQPWYAVFRGVPTEVEVVKAFDPHRANILLSAAKVGAELGA